jgi:hypothetical protein
MLSLKKILTHRSDEAMNSIVNLKKRFVISLVSVAMPKNIFIFSFTYLLESFALFYDDFCMDLYSFDSGEAMKRGDEALNASSLQFLSRVKCFIASSLQFF